MQKDWDDEKVILPLELHSTWRCFLDLRDQIDVPDDSCLSAMDRRRSAISSDQVADYCIGRATTFATPIKSTSSSQSQS